MSSEKILLALSKPRISQEIQRHLKQNGQVVCVFQDDPSIFEKIDVLIVDEIFPDRTAEIIKTLYSINPHAEVILMLLSRDREIFGRLSSEFRIFRTLPPNWTPEGIRHALKYALRRSAVRRELGEMEQALRFSANEREQLREQVLASTPEEKEHLKNLGIELRNINHRLSLLNRLIHGAQQCRSTAQVMHLLKQELQKRFLFDDILFGAKDDREIVATIKKKYQSSLAFPLISEGKCLGHIYFVSREGGRFNQATEHLDLISQVADIAAITLKNLSLHAQKARKEKEWNLTFDEIDSPIAIIDKSFQLIRTNKAYSSAAGLQISEILNQPCYKMLFGRNEPCEKCPVVNQDFGLKAELEATNRQKTYLASASPVGEAGRIVVVYKDITNLKFLYRQLESLKRFSEGGMALGSVAEKIKPILDEIVGFTQMMLQNKNPEEPSFEEIKAMEVAANRCQEIILPLIEISLSSSQREIEDIQEKSD